MNPIHRIKVWVTTLRNLRQYQNSNPVSLWFCKSLEKVPFLRLLGVQLAGLTFASAIVVPQLVNTVSTIKAREATNVTFVDVSPSTESTFQWPLGRIGISQGFSSGHPGLDLVAPRGTPIRPVAGGWVQTIIKTPWESYGNHIVIRHDNNMHSLYAHLAKIDVEDGATVTKETTIGEVGSTGHSTGDHLHLEIYQDETAVNPLEVLPALPTKNP